MQLRQDVYLAQDLYRAISNNVWIKQGQNYAYNQRQAGQLVASVRNASGCPREDYHDYLGLAGAGQVSAEIEQKLNNLGYQRILN